MMVHFSSESEQPPDNEDTEVPQTSNPNPTHGRRRTRNYDQQGNVIEMCVLFDS